MPEKKAHGDAVLLDLPATTLDSQTRAQNQQTSIQIVLHLPF